jgi:hypothetical protein
MKWIWFLGIALLALSSFPGSASVEDNQEEMARGSNTEKYRYQAIPVDHQTSGKEVIEIEFIEAERGIEYHSRVIATGSFEEISIHLDKEARFISGMRSILQPPDTPVRQERIWRDRQKVFVEKDTDGGFRKKEHQLPRDKELAVDGSLLAMLKLFPFNEGKVWNLFMVDFSGYSITVTVRQEGREKISVPAGEFECYRLVTEVNIPVLKPRITYWLWTQKPHFMVKQEGKRGPFTPSYITSLVSFE